MTDVFLELVIGSLECCSFRLHWGHLRWGFCHTGQSRAGGYWAAVQRRDSLPQCGNTINLHLQLLQASLFCNMGVRFVVFIALVLLLLAMLALHRNVCTITVSELFAVFHRLLIPSS